jgi:ubiquinone/menaquinone biosynthesis C-methylase UbiE
MATEDQSRHYYDQFAKRYDDQRGGNAPGGYHDLLDDLEVDIVRRYGTGKDVLEVGCGTGLLLTRFAEFARSAKGIDLSEGMLEKARARGLDVRCASATELPFEDAAFDVACSFKVLAHIPAIEDALSEMLRVVRPGGHVIAEFYNPWSLRYLAKKIAGARPVSESLDESAVFTRFDTPGTVAAMLSGRAELVAARGIRIVTPAAFAMKIPVLSTVLRRLEFGLADTPAAKLAGFYVAIWRKLP